MELVIEGHPALTRISEPWTDQADRELLVKEMLRIMFATNGIGLAAPQVGINSRMFVMGNRTAVYACFNPRIIESSEEQAIGPEGCLSFPGLFLNVKRPTSIKVEYEDVKNHTQTREFTGIMARCFQHELDHLDGVCFTERSSKMGLRLARERQRKFLKKNINA